MSTRFTLAAISAATLVLVLQGCGGGGGSSGGSGGTVAPAPTTAAPTDTGASTSTATGSGNTSTVFLSSYQNQLLASTQSGFVNGELPNRTVRTYARFVSPKATSGDQPVDAFVAVPTYDGRTQSATAATPSEYRFYKKKTDGSGEFARVTTADAFEGSASGCTDPNRAIVADFNGDDIPDVFLACTGNQKDNTGEYNQLVLSNAATGKFRIVNVSTGNASTDRLDGYFANSASAASADLNGDGYPDVVVVNNSPSPIVLLNDKKGGLVRELNQRMPTPDRESYFSVNLLDVDGDSKLDLVLGGSEDGTDAIETRVYLNSVGNVFTSASNFLVPKATSSRTYIMDTLVTSGASGRTMWLLRRDPSQTGGAATGREIQKVSVASLLANTATTYDPAYSNASSVAGHLLTGDKAGAPWVQVDESGENAALKADADLEIK